MKIDKIIDIGIAKVAFKGDVTDEELDYIITAGLHHMLIEGLYPEVLEALDAANKKEQEAMGYFVEGNDTVQ